MEEALREVNQVYSIPFLLIESLIGYMIGRFALLDDFTSPIAGVAFSISGVTLFFAVISIIREKQKDPS